VKKIDSRVSVAGQIRAEDIPKLAEAGVKVIVNNRPDHEEPGQLAAEEARRIAEACGIDYHHIPVRGAFITPEALSKFNEILEKSDGHILAHCRSGGRSTLLWAIAQVASGRMSFEEACAAAERHGYDVREAVRRHLPHLTPQR
jgi:uncharacterized protein (TIGR01244 family)